jgi:tRNA threonylcarbamoyladenosine biosynthesis protein TsaB
VSQTPLILNLETATEVCSVSLSKGEEILALKEAAGPNAHSKVITILIEECLHEARLALSELNGVAVSSGPGSYTSLRVGISTAKGICYALRIPLIAVDTLQALALAAYRQKKDEAVLYCPMIDARRMEVYCALFDHKNMVVAGVSSEIITENSFQDFFASGRRIVFFGNGSEKCKSILESECAGFIPVSCSANHLPHFSSKAFMAGSFVNLAYFSPNYLKAPNITTSKQKLFK